MKHKRITFVIALIYLTAGCNLPIHQQLAEPSAPAIGYPQVEADLQPEMPEKLEQTSNPGVAESHGYILFAPFA